MAPDSQAEGASRARRRPARLAPMANSAPGVAAASEAARVQSRLVALNELLEVNCALLVDRLAGLRGADAYRRGGGARC